MNEIDLAAMQQYLGSIDTIEQRDYQDAIAAIATQRNTLIILPTALGKTIVAIKVAIARLCMYPWAKIVVLAPTRPLVHQHMETFEKFLDTSGKGAGMFSACELNGKLPRAQRADQFRSANLVFATPQTMEHDLLSGTYDLTTCALLVIDECHRTGQRYAYNQVAASFMEQNPDPILMGLTASPGREIEKIMDLAQRLYIERVVMRTYDDPDVMAYVHPIEMEVEHVDLPLKYLEFEDDLRGLIAEKVGILQARGFLKGKPDQYINKMDLLQAGRILWAMVSRELGTCDGASMDDVEVTDMEIEATSSCRDESRSASGDRVGYFFWLVSIQSQAMKLMHLLELMLTQSTFTAYQFLKKIRDKAARSRKKTSANARLMAETAMLRLESFLQKAIERDEMHPKTRRMLELLEDLAAEKDPDDPGKCIVFTQFRDTVNYLVDRIEALNGGDTSPGRPFRPVRFVGQASKTPRDKGLSQMAQQDALSAFRNGTFNVLVATRIAEEGLDIPAVKHIIFYEPVPSEIRHIQRRGRTGRHETGHVTILIANGTIDEVFYRVSQSRVESMERVVGDLEGLSLQQFFRFPMIPTAQTGCVPVTGIQKVRSIAVPDADDGPEPEPAPPAGQQGPRRSIDADIDEYNITRYQDLIDEEEGAWAWIPSPWLPGASFGQQSVNWHELVKKLAPPIKRAPKHALKRERKVPASESGVRFFNKTVKWIYDQIKNLGATNADSGRLELPHAELVQMADMEEILKEDLDYAVKNGVKNKYWTVEKNAEGVAMISMSAAF
jgi:ERCC4-related helicase